MPVYSIVANDASVGTTIGSFDAIDTRNADIRLRSGTSRVVGMMFAGVPAAQTTATAVMGRLRVDSSDLGVSAEDFAVGATHGGGIATQSSAWGAPAEWIPLDWEAGGGDVVNLSFSQMGIEPGDNWTVQAAIAHLSGEAPPAAWFTASMCGGIMPLQGSRSSNGGNTTTARASLTATTISSKFSQIVSFRGLSAQDAVPASAESDSSFAEITSTIGDFEPQEYPMPAVGPALAGTLVGPGVDVFQSPLPFFMTKKRQTETVEPFVTGLDTLSAANAYGYSVGVRF